MLLFMRFVDDAEHDRETGRSLQSLQVLDERTDKAMDVKRQLSQMTQESLSFRSHFKA
jgi:hypothetical protein